MVDADDVADHGGAAEICRGFSSCSLAGDRCCDNCPMTGLTLRCLVSLGPRRRKKGSRLGRRSVVRTEGLLLAGKGGRPRNADVGGVCLKGGRWGGWRNPS